MIDLIPVSENGYRKLKRDYFAAAVDGMKQNSSVKASELVELVEQQLSPVLDQDMQSQDAFFHDIVLSGTDETVGNLWYRLHPNSYFSDMALIAWLGIDVEYRRRGLATATIQRLSDQLRPTGVRRLTLEVFNNNHIAHRLYQSIGFEAERTVMGMSI